MIGLLPLTRADTVSVSTYQRIRPFVCKRCKNQRFR